MPFSPACQAAALYAATAAREGPPPSRSAGSVGGSVLAPVSQARYGNYGGLNPEVGLINPYYDPRTKTLAQLVDPRATTHEFGGIAHGPVEWFADVGPARPKTQFAPQGPIAIEPVVLTPQPGPCLPQCAFPCPLQVYSMGAALMRVGSTLRLRDALVAAGLVVVSPELAAAGVPLCPCAVLGGWPAMCVRWREFASQYEDTPLAMVADPVGMVKTLVGVFVDGLLGTIRGNVLAAARANYARAEGPSAYLQPRPDLDFVSQEATDAAAEARALSAPGVTPCMRAAASVATGLPLQGGPCAWMQAAASMPMMMATPPPGPLGPPPSMPNVPYGLPLG